MLSPAPPISNTERQRRFRARNPGYFNKYNARRRGNPEATRAYLAAIVQTAEATVAAAATPSPLLLPAPVQLPLFPGLNLIDETPAPAPLPVSEPAKLAA
jgi:hypothetical protein